MFSSSVTLLPPVWRNVNWRSRISWLWIPSFILRLLWPGISGRLTMRMSRALEGWRTSMQRMKDLTVVRWWLSVPLVRWRAIAVVWIIIIPPAVVRVTSVMAMIWSPAVSVMSRAPFSATWSPIAIVTRCSMIDSYSLVASVDRMACRSFFPSVLPSLYTRPVCHVLHHSTYVLIFLFEFVSPKLADSMQ